MTIKDKNDNVITYTSEDGIISFDVNIFLDTVWLSQKDMAYLFDCSSDNIGLHLKNIFKIGELHKNAVTEDFSVTASDGKKYKVMHYNLDAIISVGYRVNSVRGTKFRQWATRILKQYLIDGYVINERRIKNLEDKIESLSVKLEDKFKKEIQEINKTLLEIVKKPIIIQNNNQIYNSISLGQLEEKIINLIDQIISDLKSKNKKINKFEKAKDDILKLSKDKKSKNRLMKFIKELGDENSDISKSLKGMKKVKNVAKELIKLLNDLF